MCATRHQCASRRLSQWGRRRWHIAAVGFVVIGVAHGSRINGPNVVQPGPPLLSVPLREGNEGEGGDVWAGHDYVSVILMLKLIVECGLGFVDAGWEGDRGADVALLTHGALKVDPRPFVFELDFYWHGIVPAQRAVSIAVNLGGGPKKLSILD